MYCQKPTKFLIFSLFFFGFSLFSTPTQSVSNNSYPPTDPPPTNGNHKASTTFGGDSKFSVCQQKTGISDENRQLYALISNTEISIEGKHFLRGQGLTISKNPGLWFYIPYSQNAIKGIDFLLKDDQNNLIYSSSLDRVLETGVVGIKFPLSLKLEERKYYHWYLHVRCEESVHGQREIVDGWIGVIPSTPERIEAIEKDRKDIWYDVITKLNSRILESSQQNEETIHLMNFLESAGGLEDLLQELRSQKNLKFNKPIQLPEKSDG